MRKIFIYILCLVAISKVYSQPQVLPDYLTLALNNSAVLKEAENKILVSEQEKIQAENNKPQISASVNLMEAPIFNNVGYDYNITNGALYSAQLNIQQIDLAKPFKSVAIHQQENLQATIKNSNSIYLRQLQLQITSMYIKCYVDQLLIQTIDSIINTITKQKNIITSLSNQGITKISDIRLIEITLENQLQLKNSLLI